MVSTEIQLCWAMAVSDYYTYRVTWSTEDEEHLGLCAEFPSLSWLAPTSDEALAGIREMVVGCVEDMCAQGEEPPTFGDRVHAPETS